MHFRFAAAKFHVIGETKKRCRKHRADVIIAKGDDAAALLEFDRAASILSALKDQDKSKSMDSFGSERAMVDSKRDALRQRAAMRP